MENQHLNPEHIALAAEYQSEGRYAELSDEIKTHLTHCDDCASEVLLIGDLLFEEKIKNTQKRNLKIGLVFSVAAVILVLITTTFFIPKDPIIQPKIANIDQEQSETKEKTSDTIEAKENSSPVKKQNRKVAKANAIKAESTLAYYKPNKKLEKLAQRFQESNMRSTEPTSFPVEIDLNKGESISLEHSDELFLIEIYDNKGTLVHELNSENDSIFFPELSKGLYYWKLINEDFDLIFVGKLKK